MFTFTTPPKRGIPSFAKGGNLLAQNLQFCNIFFKEIRTVPNDCFGYMLRLVCFTFLMCFKLETLRFHSLNATNMEEFGKVFRN